MGRPTKAEKQAAQDRADADAIASLDLRDILSPHLPANRAAMASHEQQAHGGMRLPGMTVERLKYADGGDQAWCVREASGAVEFRVITASDEPVAITTHSPVPVTDWPAGECALLPEGRCWADLSYLPATVLHRAWLDADRDDEVIWARLEEWHAEYLGTERRAG
jgi:hypothetical protein